MGSRTAIQSASLQGKRDENQDSHIEFDNLSGRQSKLAHVVVLGIFDGHGAHGLMMSQAVSKQFYTVLTDKRMQYPLSTSSVHTICKQVQATIADKPESEHSGTTGLIVIIYRNDSDKLEMQILNTGDCRAMISKNGIGIQLTRDQKPGSYHERLRINKLIHNYKQQQRSSSNGNDDGQHRRRQRRAELVWDGHDWRICDLSVARAYGDTDAKPFVAYQPEVYRKYRIRSDDHYIVLGCDGIWDVFNTTTLNDFIMERMEPDHNNKPVLMKRYADIAQLVCTEAIRLGSTDNVSCIVMFL